MGEKRREEWLLAAVGIQDEAYGLMTVLRGDRDLAERVVLQYNLGQAGSEQYPQDPGLYWMLLEVTVCGSEDELRTRIRVLTVLPVPVPEVGELASGAERVLPRGRPGEPACVCLGAPRPGRLDAARYGVCLEGGCR